MTLDLSVKQNISSSGITVTGTAGNAQPNVFINVPVTQIESSDNSQLSINLDNPLEPKTQTKRTTKELFNSVSSLLKQYGISLSEVETLALLERIAGCKQEVLLNVENVELKKHLGCLEAALKKQGKKGAEINLEKLAKLANDYNIVIHTGWTIEGFDKYNKNVKKSTIQDRLIATGCLSDELDVNDPNYTSKMEAAIEKFFEKTLLNRIKANTPQKEREKIYKGQLQTFGRLLVNTPDGPDKELLGAAIDKLYRSNIIPAAKAGLISMNTEEAQANFAKYIDLREAITTESEYEQGVYLSEDEAKELSNLRYSYMSAKDIKEELPALREEAIEFFDKNKDALIEINRKLESLKNNPNLKPEDILSKEEIALLREKNNLHTARYSGAITGIGSSVNSSVIESRKELLTTINSDAYNISETCNNNFYREVMQNVNEYVEAHPEALAMSKEDFINLMDEVTSGNYTTVANDIANGTETELAKPKAPISNSNNTNSEPENVQGKLGFGEKENPVSLNPSKNSVQTLYNTQTTNVTPTIVVSKNENEKPAHTNNDILTSIKENGIKGFNSYVESNGPFKVVLEVYNNLGNISNQGVIILAEKLYGMLNPSRQESVLRQVNSAAGFNNLLDQTSDKVVLNLNTNFTSYYANQQIEEAKSEAQKRSKHGLV